MALSFADSLKNHTEPLTIESEPVIADTSLMTLEEDYGFEAYSGDDGNWQQHTDYVRYYSFSDDNISVINDNKDIALNEKQFNITQEENSQYIPFEMNRYYDGFDLVSTVLSVHYVTKNGRHGSAKPVNVTFNDKKIRFGWLVDAGATVDAGTLEFEIHAYGSVTGSDGVARGYVWKTKSNKKLNVLQSLCDCEEVVNNIDDSWMQELVTDIAKKVADEIKDVAVGEQVEAAEKAAAEAEQFASDAKLYASNASSAAVDAVNVVLKKYATTDYVDKAVAGVDVTEQLASYVKTSDLEANYYTKTDTEQRVTNILEGYATKDDVANAIDSAELDNYYKKDETYSKAEVDEKVSNVKVDLTGYATETYVDNKTGILSSSISTNAENVSKLSTTVGNLQNTVNSIDTSPRLTYDVAYNDTEDADVGENVFVFYEIENEGKENEVREAKKKFTITGGSGGGGTSSSLKIGYVTTSPLVVTIDDKAIIKYTFSGTDSSGDAVPEGTATWKVAGRIVATNTAINGENSFDVTDYLSVGTQKVNLSIVDEAGSLVTKTWTVQKIDVRLESTFNDKLTYPMGKVSFDYTPYGAISKDIHFVLDGKEIGKVTTSSSGIPMAYEIPAQTHGAHLLEVYMTAEVNGNTLGVEEIIDEESGEIVGYNHTIKIVKDIIWYDSTSTVPVISTVYQSFTARQYDATNIEYTVYDPTTETPTVEIAVDGEVVSTPTLSEATNVYAFKTDVVGEHTITITCGETVKTLIATVEKLDIEVSPVTAGLVFDFNPTGYSNNDADRVWTNGTVSMAVSDNFDWVNGGYQIDGNGDQYFCIKAGTSATIDYQLFADDAKQFGKEFKLVFKTTNVASSDATFLHCMDNTTGDNHIGIQMDVQEANIYAQSGCLNLPYSEDDVIEFEFNISKNTETIPMISGYEDGVSTRHFVYDDSHNFTQTNKKIISLGSTDCDLHIYRFKVYNTSLTDRGILNNFIADARNAEEMVSRYDRNQIYDENSQLDPDVLAEKCPWLRVYKLSAPYFTNNKSDKVPHTTIQQIYKDGDPILDNWTCYDCSHSGQGTSSNNYGLAGRNLDFIMNKSQIEGVEPYFILGDGSRATEITQTRTSVPVAYLNAKVNIASANNMTNAMLANRYNKFNPYNRPFVRTASLSDVYTDEEIAAMTEDEQASALAELQAVVDAETAYVKDTMEFYNCVIFVQETNEDLSTHREFNDTNYHLYAIGNIGDSKKTDKTRLTDMDDPYECCIEIMDVNLPLSDFPKDTMMNAMGYVEDEVTHEITYTWAKDENLGILYELIDGKYVLTSDTTIDLTKTYYVDILEHDDFSEDYTYGWRYISDDEDEEIVNYCHQKWIEFYRFVTTSTDEEFKTNLKDYFVVDSALYYYLFTTRYCQVDNRAKNSFWHYGWTGEYDTDGNKIRKFDLAWGYDMDTSLGLNNYGLMAYRYGLEDTDVDEKGEEIFREMDSTFFCRIRDLFPNELKTMYNTLESQNAWHAESFINDADAWQEQFPEELWRLDIERKYIRPYGSASTTQSATTDNAIAKDKDAQFLVNMANGRMKYHRRQWERNQEKYMASKYQSSIAANDNAVLRCSAPDGELVVPKNYKLKLTPYGYMYLNVQYSTGAPIQVKGYPNVEVEIPFTGDATDIISVYSASFLKSLGDLSTCYPTTVDAGKATKLKELIIGNETEGYDNPYLTTLTTGANYLLEKLNVENVSGLTQSLNLSLLNNLEELYAHGSNITGVTFADGGNIEIAELPAINAMTMKNLIYLTTLDVTSFDKLTTLTVENCNTVDLVAILEAAPNLNRVRIVGIDWVLKDTSLLEQLYKMSGIDKNGYNTDKSVLTGKIHVPVIKQQQLYEYQKVWTDLEIIANTIIEQFAVTFMNADGTVLEVQYIDKGEDAVDPTKRTDNPLSPTIASTISHDFTFAGWDSSLLDIFSERTITATYTESLRSYTIKYVSKGVTMQESTGLYGENISYTGVDPTYTAEEGGYVYYLFNRWDKSGFIDGEKIVNAIFDRFEYTATSFDGKELADLSPVEIYAMNKLGLAESIITNKDPYTIIVGNDVDYDDIDSELLISEKTSFDGTNYIDTGIQLFDVDKDFVLAMDYEFLSGNTANAVLAQCFQANGTNGFKLWYSNGARLTWGTSYDNVVEVNKREILVVRHKKGDNNLYIYKSNLDGDEVLTVELTRTKTTIGTSTLVFGCAKADDGYYENHAIGNINWAKVWYADLGDDVCKDLAIWTHEFITLEACGFRKYYLSDNTSKRCSFSLLASHLLGRTKMWNATNINDGGWAASTLNKSLNTRLYNAMPTQIRALMKQVIVYSNDGLENTAVTPTTYYKEVTPSNCYITIPALIEVDPTQTSEPYNSEGISISYLSTNESRKRTFDNGDYNAYWLRSPNAAYAHYIWRVDENGQTQGITNAQTPLGVLIELSF